MRIDRIEQARRVGLTLFLASFAICTAALLLSCWTVRLATPLYAWAAPVAPAFGYVATAVLAASSYLVWQRRFGLAIFFGALFLGIQVGLWHHLWRRDLFATSQGASVLLLTGFHALHTAIGLGGLVSVFRRRASFTLWTRYWHAMGVCWLCLAAFLYW